ncbi:hypothetical protein VNO78_33975 [Psophocarpus tetragonolobus]|uniref:Uncharacterized protein n=1 Tax=Psophocarpus tetragonolobus TaxID=3891 RepID=A0AAN9NYB0_PSOTE
MEEHTLKHFEFENDNTSNHGAEVSMRKPYVGIGYESQKNRGELNALSRLAEKEDLARSHLELNSTVAAVNLSAQRKGVNPSKKGNKLYTRNFDSYYYVLPMPPKLKKALTYIRLVPFQTKTISVVVHSFFKKRKHKPSLPESFHFLHKVALRFRCFVSQKPEN